MGFCRLTHQIANPTNAVKVVVVHRVESNAIITNIIGDGATRQGRKLKERHGSQKKDTLGHMDIRNEQTFNSCVRIAKNTVYIARINYEVGALKRAHRNNGIVQARIDDVSASLVLVEAKREFE